MDIRYGLYIKWSPDDNDYTDETDRLMWAEGSSNLVDPSARVMGGKGMVGQTSLILDNHDGRFSIDYSGTPLASKLSTWKFHMAPGYLKVSVDGGETYDNVASFLISHPEETIIRYNQHPVVEWTCYDRAYWLMQNLYTTELLSEWLDSDNDRWHQYREDVLTASMLQRAGFVDGVDFVSQSHHNNYPNIEATLEPGMVPISWFWLEKESMWDELQRLAGSCLGYFLHTPGSPSSPNGWFRYWNMTHWLNAFRTGPQLTLYLGNTEDMTPKWDTDEFYSKVTVTVSPRIPGVIRDIWEASTLPFIRPGETTHILANFSSPASQVYTMRATDDYYAASTTGVNMTTNIQVSNWHQYAQRVEFDLTNNHASRSAQFYKLKIRGRQLESLDDFEAEAESDLSYWNAGLRPPRVREVTGNAYIQHKTHGDTIAQVLLRESENMRFRAKVTLAGSVHPRRRLGDTVRVVNTRSGWDLVCVLLGLRWSLGRNTFTQDIDVVDARAFYPASDFFTCGRHALGAAPPPGGFESTEVTPTAGLFW